MDTFRRPVRFPLISVIILALAPVLPACDASESTRTCEVIDVNNHFKAISFLDNNLVAVAEFHLEQKITTYETGGCNLPSSDTDGVRLVIRNLTMCTLDLNYSLSAFVGGDGWTVTGSDRIESGRTTDVGIIVRRNSPLVDLAQILLTGSSVLSNCV